MVQPCRPTSKKESLKGYMNPNMSIYRRLNPKLLLQVEMGLGLLHWSILLSFVRVILDILAQCNKSKPIPACTSSLGFNHLYILMLGFIVTRIIILHSYTIKM